MTANLVVLKNVIGNDTAKAATAADVAYLRKWLDEANAEQLGNFMLWANSSRRERCTSCISTCWEHDTCCL